MPDQLTLAAKSRTVLGKKVKNLRREGVLPANVYGRGVESTAIQLDGRDFRRAIGQAGIRSMFELSIEGEKESRHVLVRGLDREGGTGDPIHVDFYQVDLNRPIQTTTAIRLVGIPPAVTDLGGTLLQNLETVAIRCLPLDIPEAIELDVSSIENFELSLSVGDLEVPEGVEVLAASDIGVATVDAPRLTIEGEEEEGEELEGEEGEEGEAMEGEEGAESSAEGADEEA
ncbi:MAG: 50S ribosomal protein L25 [Dehalococcoidia bacterium]|mgnify:CR=1 FL=1|nr:50S ribosomal protein L25 [Dehalococcoidia bacterium]HCV00374.1 50S ribosomal protein L25 [Dehalococcoidia bacterium]|tara:strand:- start:2384 stop:3070 length:687 start_codon:yes stop_codon:yes gene_type:complete